VKILSAAVIADSDITQLMRRQLTQFAAIVAGSTWTRSRR
jgi:hypothetical protein